MLYLGFLIIAEASWIEIDSGMKMSLVILIRSQWHFLMSVAMLVSEAAESSLHSEGKGPAIWSPSKRVASAGQDFKTTTGMLSLKQRIF